MSAAEELYNSFDAVSQLCKRCCDVMYVLADYMGVTYETLNMWAFYILQPCIYSLLLLWELLYLYRRAKNKTLKSGLLYASFIPVGYMATVALTFLGKDLDALCLVKIKNLFDAAHAVGMSYAAINILIFILGFLFICFLHLLFYRYRKTKFAYVVAALFLLISPFFVFVFNI